MRRRPTRLTILGAGALARAMTRAIPRGERVTVAARRGTDARAVARLRAGTTTRKTFEDAVRDADVVLLAVDDRAIEAVAARIAPSRPSWRGVVVLHAAGALGPELLKPLKALGAATGVLHPMTPIARDGGAALRGAAARIEGDPKARAAARRLAVSVGLRPLPAGVWRASTRDLYHAAASLATNDVVALVALAEKALRGAGIARPAARRAVLAAASGTLGRIAAAGTEGALSGPVPRGDVPRVVRQLGALRRLGGGATGAHRALTLVLIDLARGAGALGAAEAAALRRAAGRRTV